MNNFLLFIAGLLVAVLTALFAIPPMINWNDFRGTFEEEASRLLDREVRVRGDVSVRILPVPYVSFEKVRIADAPGVPGSFARADQFKMWLSVPPLLRGVIEARQIELERPVVRLRTEADGTGNWRKLRISDRNLAYIPREVALNSVRITDGTLLFESHRGHEIAKLNKISGELVAGSLTGPYKFIGTTPFSSNPQEPAHEVRVSTAQMDQNGEVRFSGSVRSADNASVNTLNGTLFDLLGTARGEGVLRSRSRPLKNGELTQRIAAGYEMTSDVKLDTSALALENISIAFRNKDRQQTLKGAARTSWREGLVTETNLAADWLDLDAIAGTLPGEGPLRAVERLLTGGVEPLGAGVTSLTLKIEQANLAGTSISDLSGRMVRRDGVTKVEELRASLPGRSALAMDGFLERRETGLQFDGNMLLNSASFAELAKWLRVEVGDETLTALQTSFSVAGNIRVRPKNVELSDAVVRLADDVAEGGVRYDWTTRPSLIANVDAGTLRLEKFGRDLLAPANVAQLLGFTDNPKAKTSDSQSARGVWHQTMDLTLQLKASRITDGRRVWSDVDLDIGRIGEELRIAKLNASWEPGLKVALTGTIREVSTKPAGSVAGTLSVADDNAAQNLISLLSFGADASIPPNALANITPLRVALDVKLRDQGAGGTPSEKAVLSSFVADGTLGDDRVRIEGRTAGGLTEWRNQIATVQARLTGRSAASTVGRLLGAPLGSTATGRVGRAGLDTSQPKQSTTIVISAVGRPLAGMKSFVRVDAGEALKADFAGDIRLVEGAGTMASAWSGTLDVKGSTSQLLAALVWPAMQTRVSSASVSGSVRIATTDAGYRFEPQRLQVGQARVDGNLEVAREKDNALAAITGKLSITEIKLPALKSLVLGAGRVPRGDVSNADEDLEVSDLVWPEAPFDLTHLEGVTTDLIINVKALKLDAGGIPINHATFQLKRGPSRLAINNFSGMYAKSMVAGSAALEELQAGVRMMAKVSAKDMPLGLWASEIEKSNRLGGRFDVDLEFSGQALTPRSLSTLLEGKGLVKLSDAAVPGLSSAIVTEAARKAIDGELEIDALSSELNELASNGSVNLGSPTLDGRIVNGTLSLPTMVFDGAAGALRNATTIDLARWRMESRWTATPAPQPRPDAPEQKVPLPPITIIYEGTLDRVPEIEPRINLGDLERELVVRKMEANVARLEQLRREDEARAAAERERQRLLEEAQRLSIEEERRRRRDQRNVAPDRQGAAGDRVLRAPDPVIAAPPRVERRRP